jgi:hypothetical protein
MGLTLPIRLSGRVWSIDMPVFRLRPAKYPISIETASPEAGVGSEDIERIDVLGNSWGDRWWKGPEIAPFRRRLEARCLAAKAAEEKSVDDPSMPLATVIEDILRVVREAERVSDAYDLWYAGD